MHIFTITSIQNVFCFPGTQRSLQMFSLFPRTGFHFFVLRKSTQLKKAIMASSLHIIVSNECLLAKKAEQSSQYRKNFQLSGSLKYCNLLSWPATDPTYCPSQLRLLTVSIVSDFGFDLTPTKHRQAWRLIAKTKYVAKFFLSIEKSYISKTTNSTYLLLVPK